MYRCCNLPAFALLRDERYTAVALVA